MPAHNIHRTFTEIEHQLTQIDEDRKLASEILKRVDHLIKAKDLQKALLETNNAIKIDPQNAYALALEERIQGLFAEQSKIQPQKEEIRSPAEFATVAPKERAEETLPRLPPAMPQNIDQTSHSVTRTVARIQQSVILMTARTPTEYHHRPRHALITDSRQKENDAPKVQRPKVVIIDDDQDLLYALSQSIESAGFEAIALTTSDEAYILLTKFTPDIILCDINLETSTMGGFTFFEKVQEIEHLKHIPFIFLSGLNDDVMIRAGKEMGADDYLTKPIKEQNLLAALRGKLKRFKQLREIPSTNIHNFPAAFPLHELRS
jgi:CheY-like chemotaxis protein